MIKWKFYFFLISIQFIFSKENPYRKFQEFINSKENHIFNIEINQKQLDKIYISTGLLQFISKDYYIFDDQNQRITNKGGTIKTINKKTRQIIYDSIIKNDINIIDILTGKDRGIVINNSRLDDENSRISFTIKNFDISGVLWTITETGEPKKIKLMTNQDMEIEINILSSSFNFNKSLSVIDTSGYEIVNLRE